MTRLSIRVALWASLLGVLMAAAGMRATAEPSAQPKIGYVILPKVIDGYQRTKQSDAKFTEQSKQKEAELQARIADLKKQREGLELLNDKAREAKTREIEQKADALQQFRNSATRDLTRERQKLMSEIADDVQQAVSDYAKANAYTLILKDEALLYGDSSHDITDDVLKALNARFAGGAPAAKNER